MNQAGAAAFQLLRQRWPKAWRIEVVCGGGNNGGDGYVVARLARQAGLDARIMTLADPESLHGDALSAAQEARAAEVPITAFNVADLTEADLLVDAILGTGLEREVSGAWREAIAAMNAHPTAVLALDIPSGLHADTGAVLGAAIQAEVTLTFIGLKQGLFTGQGPACCGEIHFTSLGVPPDIYPALHPASWRYVGDDLPTLLPHRSRSAHKGHFGHVLVIGGDLGMAGAARMSAEAAARCGAGLVSVATRSVHAGLQAAVRPELMFHGIETPDQLAPLLNRATVIAIGPGLGRGDWGRTMPVSYTHLDVYKRQFQHPAAIAGPDAVAQDAVGPGECMSALFDGQDFAQSGIQHGAESADAAFMQSGVHGGGDSRVRTRDVYKRQSDRSAG